MRLGSISRSLWAISTVLIMIIAAAASASVPAAWQSKVSQDLLTVYESNEMAQTSSAKLRVTAPVAVTKLSPARFDAQGRVQVDIHFDCANVAPISSLKELGFAVGVTLKLPPLCIVEGWTASTALPAIASILSVKQIELPKYAAPRHPPAHAKGLI
jgi:hypothetical protein